MAANVFAGSNVVIAIANVPFVEADISSDNTNVITRVRPTQTVSFDPSRSLNPITSFEEGEGYYIILKADIDLNGVVSKTVTVSGGGGGSTGGAILLEDGGQVLTQAAT